MVMARPLPAQIENTPQELSDFEEQVLNLLADGWTVGRIAKHVAPNNPKKRKVMRQKIRRIANRPEVQEAAGLMAKANLVLGVLPTSEAIVRKAVAGRVDAAKLVFEASGFHNPRTEVAHSGDIQITIKGLPRPEQVVDETVVSDADVID